MKRSITAILAGGAVFGATVAFAATLTVDGNNLGAGDGPVTTCDTAPSTEYTVGWDDGEFYEVTSVKVSAATPACDGQLVQIELLDTDGDSLGGSTAAKALSSGSVTFGSADLDDDVSAEAVDNIAVTIYDAP